MYSQTSYLLMKEIKAIVEAYHKIDFTKNKAALATVIRVEGSSYRREGARMLIIDSGEWIGGISGGCLEGDALKKAKFAIAQNKATVVTYDTSEDDPFQIGVGLGCNGIIDILITPIDSQNSDNQVLALEKCLNVRAINKLFSIIKLKGDFGNSQIGQTIFVEPDDCFYKELLPHDIQMDIWSDMCECQLEKKSAIKNYKSASGEIQLFIEILPPPIHLIIYGGNYDIYSMVRIAKEVGWKVSVVCNPLKINKILFELADELIEKEKGLEVEIDPYTVSLLMAHDYETDFNNMCRLLKTDIPYIGMLGPKKRTDKMFLKLKEERKPVSEEDLLRIATPVGLDIGAETPEEIAISIIAEIKTFFSGRSGQRLRFRDGAIYGV
jgi:xanthine dehydrogenase accessory factor